MTGSPGRKVIRPRLLPSVIVALMTGLLLWLGTWQLQRAGEKRELITAYEGDEKVLAWRALGDTPERFTRVWLEGEYDGERQTLQDGMSHQTRPGYHVLTPFRMLDGRLVIVNRGWRQWRWPRTDLPDLPVPQGRQRIEGRVSVFVRPGLRLAEGNALEADSWPRVAVYPSAADLAGWLDEDVDENLVLLEADQEAGFVRDWRPAALPPSRHLGYALQWYALALALVVMFLIASRRVPNDETDEQ